MILARRLAFAARCSRPPNLRCPPVGVVPVASPPAVRHGAPPARLPWWPCRHRARSFQRASGLARSRRGRARDVAGEETDFKIFCLKTIKSLSFLSRGRDASYIYLGALRTKSHVHITIYP